MPDLPPLIQALLNPARYPDPADSVALMQTHGAWVLLAGEHVYKIKKPVALAFMDFSSLSARRAACEAELRVNRRYESADPATHLYIEALPITGTAAAPRLGGDPALALEWAVHLRRFPEADRLDHVAQRGELTVAMTQSLARRLAALQARAAVAGVESPWGRTAEVAALARDNLGALLAAQPGEADRATLTALGRWTERALARLAPLLEQRRAEGRVREGHGDLHLANLVRIGGEAQAFDAIEFNEALRWIDTASDIAFTWMDLLRIGQAGLANLFLSEWLDASGDVSAPEVLPFFAVYRTLVRTKVAAIGLSEGLPLAQRIAEPPAPRLLITHGLSGSGKTFASTRWLANETSGRAIRLRSDVERKRLHGLSALAPSGSGLNSGLYSPQAHGDTYAALRERAGALLAEGWSVVVDAAFLRRHERAALAALADGLGLPFHILACEAPVEALRRRISQRQAAGTDASEATLAVLEQQLGWLEPLSADERARCLTPP